MIYVDPYELPIKQTAKWRRINMTTIGIVTAIVVGALMICDTLRGCTDRIVKAIIAKDTD